MKAYLAVMISYIIVTRFLTTKPKFDHINYREDKNLLGLNFHLSYNIRYLTAILVYTGSGFLATKTQLYKS